MSFKVLIIGRYSFIAKNLYDFLIKKNIEVKKVKFEFFKKNYNQFVKSYNFCINCSINPNYSTKKYNLKYDNDFFVADKIKNTKCTQIMLSTRKVYKPGENLKENTKIYPNCNYSKNKAITEKKLIQIFKKKVLILRVGNLIGFISNNRRRVHRTFIDIFFENIKKNIVFDNQQNFKDFISIKKLSEAIFLLMKNGAFGIYNVSLGKKIFLNEIIDWLNYYNQSKVNIKTLKKNFNTDNFTLNNDKLMKKINFKNTVNNLKTECLKISKKNFN